MGLNFSQPQPLPRQDIVELGQGDIDLKASSVLNANARYGDIEDVLFSGTNSLSQLEESKMTDEQKLKFAMDSTREKKEALSVVSNHDIDSQLMLIIAFRKPVKLISLEISGTPLIIDNIAADVPKKISLFANKPSLNFTDMEDVLPTFSYEMVGTNHQELVPACKFDNLSTLTIFVSSNQSNSQQTLINRIIMKAIRIDDFDVSQLSKGSNPIGAADFCTPVPKVTLDRDLA